MRKSSVCAVLIVALARFGNAESIVEGGLARQAEGYVRDWLQRSFALGPRISDLEVLELEPAKLSVKILGTALFEPLGLRTKPGEPQVFVWRGMAKDPVSRLATPIQIRFRLFASLQQVVSRHPISAGRILTAEDLAIRYRAWQPGSVASPLEITDCIGLQLSRSLRSGDVVRGEWLRPAPAVHAGEEVLLRSAWKGIELTARAVASQQGRVGEAILIKRLDNGIRLRGLVESPGVVRPLIEHESRSGK